jgi:hypothetical protein
MNPGSSFYLVFLSFQQWRAITIAGLVGEVWRGWKREVSERRENWKQDVNQLTNSLI